MLETEAIQACIISTMYKSAAHVARMLRVLITRLAALACAIRCLVVRRALPGVGLGIALRVVVKWMVSARWLGAPGPMYECDCQCGCTNEDLWQRYRRCDQCGNFVCPFCRRYRSWYLLCHWCLNEGDEGMSLFKHTTNSNANVVLTIRNDN